MSTEITTTEQTALESLEAARAKLRAAYEQADDQTAALIAEGFTSIEQFGAQMMELIEHSRHLFQDMLAQRDTLKTKLELLEYELKTDPYGSDHPTIKALMRRMQEEAEAVAQDRADAIIEAHEDEMTTQAQAHAEARVRKAITSNMRDQFFNARFGMDHLLKLLEGTDSYLQLDEYERRVIRETVEAAVERAEATRKAQYQDYLNAMKKRGSELGLSEAS